VAAQRPLIVPASSSKPGQGSVINQIQLSPENPQSTAPLPVNTLVLKQGHPPAAASPVSQAISVAQPSNSTVTTASSLPTSAAVPAGSALIFDPQLGILRPQSLGSQTYLNFNQQVLGTTLDGKTIPLQGGLPSYYQTIPVSLVSSVPAQTVGQSPGVQGQAGVGNGLLVTAVGIVPGMNQPGMVYASQLSDMAQKQGLENRAEMSPGPSSESDRRDDSQADVGLPDAKKAKLDGQ